MHVGYFDEAFDADGSVRPHYAAVVSGWPSWHQRVAGRARLLTSLRTAGISSRLREDDGIERTFPMDLFRD